MFAEVNGTRIHYLREGQGTDVVLLPGLGGSVHFWYAQRQSLSSVCRLTTIDPRGHGQSDRPPGPYSMRQMAEDVRGVMDAAGCEQAIIVGSSMSSLVAVEFAAAYPQRAQGLVLVGGFARLDAAGKERMEARARIAETEGMAALPDLVASTALAPVTHQTQPALVGLFKRALLANDPHGYAAACRAIVEADVTPLLAQVRTPTLVLLGEQELVAPLPAARALTRGLPNAQLKVIPNAGHLPFLEQPAAFNAALLEFIGNLS